MNGIRLSEHFWLSEFTRSDYAARNGLEIIPTELETENLRRLCTTVLEPVRLELAVPMFITSGLRPVWLNKAIGGSSTSDHMQGCAADFIAYGMSPRRVCERIVKMDLPFKQLILEFDQWTHVSVPVLRLMAGQQVLTARRNNGKAEYLVGIV